MKHLFNVCYESKYGSVWHDTFGMLIVADDAEGAKQAIRSRFSGQDLLIWSVEDLGPHPAADNNDEELTWPR